MVQHIIAYVFGGIVAVFALIGYLNRSKRLPLWLGAVSAGLAAGAAWSDAFWPMTTLGIITLAAGFAATNLVDMSWRVRAGIVMSVGLLGFFALWPTLETITKHKLPCPAFVKDRIGFRLVAGLDLRGGLRLVYTVDVDEAIKDKRDRYYEEMRTELAKLLGLHSGDEVPSEETYVKLREKVKLEAPRRPANVIKLTLLGDTDPNVIDSRFLDRFRGDLTFSQSADKKTWNFRIKEESETGIRQRAVNQARGDHPASRGRARSTRGRSQHPG